MAEIHEVHRSVEGRQVRDLTKKASSGAEGGMDEIEELENLILGHMLKHIDGGDKVKLSGRVAQELHALRSIRHFSRPGCGQPPTAEG